MPLFNGVKCLLAELYLEYIVGAQLDGASSSANGPDEIC